MAFVIYLASIVVGVLFFGAIHTWAYTLVFLGVIAASLLLIKNSVVRRETSSTEEGGRVAGLSGPHLRWIRTDLDPLFFLFFAFLIVQMIPLPGWLLGLLSPEATLVGKMSQPAQLAVDTAVRDVSWHSLAPYFHPVRMSLIRWIIYGLLFYGLIRCLNSRRRLETAVVVLLLLGSLDALYGILQTYSGHGYVWWFKSTGYGRDVGGTFLNRNLFAGFMEMTITLAVAYAATLAGRKSSRPGDSASSRPRSSFKKRLLTLFSEDTKNYKFILTVFAGGVMGLGLILSASRGGIIATAAALLLMGIIFSFRRSERRTGRIILVLFGIAMIFALHAGIDYTVGRFHSIDRSMGVRLVRAQKTLELFSDYVLAGVGIGNFRHAYGKYQDPVDKNFYVDFAHNDYAQFLSEAGIIGAILLLAGFGWYAVRTIRLWRRRSSSLAVYLGIAPFVALFAIAIHAVSDYNLHRPAHMMTLVALAAIGCAALRLEPGRRDGRFDHPVRLIPLRPWGAVFLAGAIGLMIWSAVWTVRHFIAETYCNTDVNITMNLDPNPPAERVQRAITWNPLNAAYPFKLARAMMKERDRRMAGPSRDEEGWRRSRDPIIAGLERAIRLNAWNAEYHVRLAWEYSYLYDRPDYITRWLPAADLCMNRAAGLVGNWSPNPRLHKDMGNYWMMRSRLSTPDDPNGEIARTKARWYFK